MAALLFRIGAMFWISSLAPFRPGSFIDPIIGPTANGTLYDGTAVSSPCHLVRYSSSRCPYCRSSIAEPWRRLRSAVSSRGCDILSLSPLGSDYPQSEIQPGPLQHLIIAVPVPGPRSQLFQETPVSVLVDGRWQIIWSKLGVVVDRDVTSAVLSLSRALRNGDGVVAP